MNRPCRLLPLLTLAALVVAGLASPPPARADQPGASAAESAASAPASTTLRLTVSRGRADSRTPATVRLTGDQGPVAGARVVVQRRGGGSWQRVTSLTTDATGAASARVVLARRKVHNRFRARYAGDAAHAPATSTVVRADLRRRGVRLRMGGDDTVVDGRRATLRVRYRTGGGEPVAGRVQVYKRSASRAWRRVANRRTDDRGRLTLRVRPRVDTRWKVRAPQRAWIRGGWSRVHRLDNRPPGRPVMLPRNAPHPRVSLPRQRRAVGSGPNVRIGRIPDGVWRSMVGRSWHRGCPVGRAGLRLVRLNYWGYDGYRYRGELVAAAGAADNMAGALAEMYRRGFPVRAMYRVDRFGWSRRLNGADDYRSMAAGNTSAFNCRSVVNRPGVRSPHSWGRSLDVNTWENPYRSRTGLVPNRWWQFHPHPRVAWRSRSHAVVRIMARHGLRWTYGTDDSQHFDVPRDGRVVAPRECAPLACD